MADGAGGALLGWLDARSGAVTAQACAQAGQQRVVRGLDQVGHFDTLGFALATGGPDADQRAAFAQAPGGQRGLGLDLIAGVDQNIHRGGQQRWPVGRGDEVLHAVHLAARMDGGDALAQRRHLGLAQRVVQRLHLAVDVGFGDLVQVEQHQLCHATACQGLNRPRPDPTQPHDGDAGCAQAAVTRVAVQAAQAAETALQVGLVQWTGW